VIRCGVNLIPDVPVAEVVELAVHAERLGYHRCWVFDEGLATRDLYVTLSAIGLATKRMMIGPGITNPYTRHPATTAAAVASLDELTGGRVFLGVGVGGSLTLDPLDIERPHPVVAVSELIEACRRLFTGEPVDMDGRNFGLRGASLGYGRTGIEVWLAGRGPRMISMGGAHADGVMLEFLHRDLIGKAVDRVRTGGREIGNKARLAYGTMVITDQTGVEATKPHLTYRLVDSTPEVRTLLGISDRDIDRIRTAMPQGLGEAGRYVKDDWVYPFVIYGSPGECRNQMEDLMERYGFDEFVLPVLDATTARSQMEMVAGIIG